MFASSLLLSIIGFGVIAATDYVWELDRTARAVLLNAMASGVAAFAVSSLWPTLTHTGRPATAAEIEAAFPELGQSVRTTVQFSAMKAEHVQSEGVAPTLVAVLTETSYRSLEVLPGNQTVDEGSGTLATVGITFDKPVKSASIVLAPRRKPLDDEDQNEPVIVPLVEWSAGAAPAQEGGNSMSVASTFTASLTLNEDRNYSIVAEAVGGATLPETKYRIRVREDQPPQVTFESPDDAIEVHTLAELPMRIRVRDDYGLTKAGVIFQVNNEQTIPLIAQDFATADSKR